MLEAIGTCNINIHAVLGGSVIEDFRSELAKVRIECAGPAFRLQMTTPLPYFETPPATSFYDCFNSKEASALFEVLCVESVEYCS